MFRFIETISDRTMTSVDPLSGLSDRERQLLLKPIHSGGIYSHPWDGFHKPGPTGLAKFLWNRDDRSDIPKDVTVSSFVLVLDFLSSANSFNAIGPGTEIRKPYQMILHFKTWVFIFR